MVYLNGILVHWRARIERLIIKTTVAGDYVALNRGNTTAKFIRDVLQFYGNTTNIHHLYTDNQVAEHIATQPTMNEDMSRRASKNVSQGQSVIHGDAHN